jgi:hypothetical protein
LVVGRYQPLADGSGCLCFPLPDQTCLLQSLQKTKRSASRTCRTTILFGFWVDIFADASLQKRRSHKAQKGRRWENRQPSHSALKIT